MNISELMRQTGVSRKAIYLYESKGLISPSKIAWNGYRDYDEGDLQRLRTIVRLRELDVPLSIIARIFTSPQNADIHLQACMEEKKRELRDLWLTMGRLYDVIHKMPPNGSLDDFDGVAAAAFSEKQQDALLYKIQQDYPHEYDRRILMNAFEAFLDSPIDTVAKKETWQRILALNEAAITQELLEGYAYFYGAYSPEELEQDFLLRRKRVTAVAKCRTEEEFQEKAEEIFRDAENTARHAELMWAWKEYYTLFVQPMLASYAYEDGLIGDLINALSPTLEQYNASFQRISGFLTERFASEDGRKVIAAFEGQFGSDYPRGLTDLTYFDFYNYSLREIVRKRK